MSTLRSQCWDPVWFESCRPRACCHSLSSCILVLLCIQNAISLESSHHLWLFQFLSPLLHRWTLKLRVWWKISHLGLRVPKSITACTLSSCRSLLIKAYCKKCGWVLSICLLYRHNSMCVIRSDFIVIFFSIIIVLHTHTPLSPWSILVSGYWPL